MNLNNKLNCCYPTWENKCFIKRKRYRLSGVNEKQAKIKTPQINMCINQKISNEKATKKI